MRSLLREVEKLAIQSPALRRTLVLQRCPSGLVEVISIERPPMSGPGRMLVQGWAGRHG
jgi:hypothetical protein